MRVYLCLYKTGDFDCLIEAFKYRATYETVSELELKTIENLEEVLDGMYTMAECFGHSESDFELFVKWGHRYFLLKDVRDVSKANLDMGIPQILERLLELKRFTIL